MHKSVHRQIEVPAICGAVNPPPLGCCGCCHTQAGSDMVRDQESFTELKVQCAKYNRPKLNTVLRQVQEVEHLQSLRPAQYKNLHDLTPRSKAIIAPKITKKLNFHPDQTVFKNLAPINVNDSILLPQKAAAISKKYVKSANKVVVPDLFDFLTPIPPLNHVIPEPEISMQFPSHSFDYFGSYTRLLN